MIHVESKTQAMKCFQYYCFVILKTVLGSIITSDNFVQVKTDYVIRTGGALLQKRSVIECSKACLTGANDCGFNYVKHNRQCACVTSNDLQGMSMETKPGASVYIHGQCTQEFQEQLRASTSKTMSMSTTITTTSKITVSPPLSAATTMQLSTTTTTTLQTSKASMSSLETYTTSTKNPQLFTPRTTTPHTATSNTTTPKTSTTTMSTPQTLTTTMSTPQTSTTTMSTPQTSTTTMSTPQTSTTTTTTPQTSTTTMSTLHASTTTTTQPQTSTTITTTQQTSTATHLMTVSNSLGTAVSNFFATMNTMPVEPTTITSVRACVPEALLCQSGFVRLFSSSGVFTYASYYHLTSGSLSTETVKSLCPMTSENVIAAYADTTFVYLITEDDQVHKYENGRTYIFIEKKSLNEHFDGEAPSNIDDVIYTSDNNVYIFSDDNVHIIKPSYDVEEISLDDNGNKNVYKSKNFSDRPKAIAAACEIDADTHIFISDGSVYVFFFSTTQWINVGRLKC